jgi:NADH-ubiquinone oxidoreductase chain 4
MINLTSLIIIPILFIVFVLYLSSNYKIKSRLVETNSFKHITLLEEKRSKIPYILRQYYLDVIFITSSLTTCIISNTFWEENTDWKRKKESIIRRDNKVQILKRTGLILSLILFALIIFFWFKYRPNTINYQLLTDAESKDQKYNMNLTLGLDGISLPFVLLVGFIMPLVYLSNWSTIDSLDIYYIIIIILLELFLITVFLVIDLIMFYIFFESILPPLFVLIGLYGASQKFRAGYYLFLYTLFGSLFMLVSFVKLGGDTASTYFNGYGNNNIYELLQEIIWIVLFVSFSVKTPLVPVHIWLPLAHSDANVSGSIVLASIVLKLALYGFLRILIGIFSMATLSLIPFFFGLCALSVVYSSFTTIRQFDLKVLVAYSSIAHMASSLLGTFSDTLYGLVGSVVFGLAHGFVSPGLFILVGAILYDRCGSRIINYYRGLTNILPFFAFLFLLFVFGNMGVPLTGNFIGEFLSLLGAYQQNIFIASIAATSVILSAVYSIFMFNRVTGGSLSPYIHTIPDVFRKEFFILLPLLVLTLILGIYPSFITNEIDYALSNLLLSFPLVFYSSQISIKKA